MNEFRLNLQLFAVGETNNTTGAVASASVISAMETTGSAGLSFEMKEFYSKDLIEMASANLVYAQFGEKVSIPKNGGKKIEWRKFSKFKKALKPLTEGVTPAPSILEVTHVEKELEQFGDYSIVSDMLELTAIDNIIVEYTQRHAENAHLTLDTIVRNDLMTGTNVYYCGGQSDRTDITSNDTLKVTDIAVASTILKNMNAPKFDGSYICIIHPSVALDLLTNQDWIDVNKYSNATAIFNGEIGKLYGVRFIETTECAYFTNDTTDQTGIVVPSSTETYKVPRVYGCLMLGKGAYKVTDINGENMEVIVKTPNNNTVSDPLSQRSSIGWKGCYGSAIVIPEYILRIECSASIDGLGE